MFHYTFLLALLIVWIRPVQGEGRTWLSHHGAAPPSPSSGSRRGGSSKALDEKKAWLQTTTTTVKPVSRIVPHNNPLVLQADLTDEDKMIKHNKYPYASGAFGFEPELGIH